MSEEKIIIFDTTLRDGEQAPGASLSITEKLEIAQQLAKLGVDVIEAGFPVSSPAQFEATRLVAEQVTGPVIAGLARTNQQDIEAAGKAVEPAKKKRIHTFIATSPIHMTHKLKKTADEVLKMAVEAVKYAKTFTDDVEFSPEDACRSEMPFLIEVLTACIEAGATTLNIPDTVGYILPYEYGRIIARLKSETKGIDKCVISTHCHNDLGMAVANSLAGVRNGARQVECAINGMGERAGNAALEEIVMAVHTRADFFSEDDKTLSTNINTREIYRTSQLVSRLTGFVIQPNKAVVGANAFAHEAGVHVDGVLKDRATYEIMTPETIGLSGSMFVLGRHSGRHGFTDRCKQLGFKLTGPELEQAYQRFLEIADKKKEVFDEDIAAIISDEIHVVVEKIYELEYLHVACGTGTLPTASVKIKTRGETRQAAACGDGPVDAAYEAIKDATGRSPKIEDYSIKAVTSGKEALGEATVKISEQGRTYIGRGISTDIIEASARAYIDAINRMVSTQAKGEQPELKAEL
jgi:2-isopropylmalate synthase